MRSVFLALAAVACFAPRGGAAELRVPGQYSSIQAAIGAAQPGDTVVVTGGRYHESLDMKGAVAVVASGGATLDASGFDVGVSFGYGAAGSSLSGLIIEGSAGPNTAWGVGQAGSDGVHIDHVTVRGRWPAFALWGSSGLVVASCTAVGGAIFAGQCNIVVDGCTVDGAPNGGIVISHGARARLVNNRVTGSGVGIIVKQADTANDPDRAAAFAILSGNVAQQNVRGGLFVLGSTVWSSDDVIEASGGDGVVVENDASVTLERARVQENAGDGVRAQQPQLLDLCDDPDCTTSETVLEARPARVWIADSLVEGNGGNGVVSRAGAEVRITGSSVHANGASRRSDGHGILVDPIFAWTDDAGMGQSIDMSSNAIASRTQVEANRGYGAVCLGDGALVLHALNSFVDNRAGAVWNDVGFPASLDAMDNWWGTAKRGAIKAQMKGDVTFEPFLRTKP
jgi:hypothetical protein